MCACVCDLGVARFNNRKRAEVFLFLLERDGAICMGCDKKHVLDLKKARIDHMDQDPDHNCPKNWRLVCNAFNVKKRQLPILPSPICVCDCGYDPNQPKAPAGEGGDPEAPVLSEALAGAKIRIDDLEADKTRTATMRKNDKCEAPFNKWLNSMLDDGEAYTYDEYSNAGALTFECSVETIKRYLNKRLDLPDCNPINGDLTLRPGKGNRLCVTWKERERFYFK